MRHSRSFPGGNSDLIRLPAAESDLPTEINAEEGLENETLYQLDSCPLQTHPHSSILFLSGIPLALETSLLFLPLSCQTECVPPDKAAKSSRKIGSSRRNGGTTGLRGDAGK